MAKSKVMTTEQKLLLGEKGLIPHMWEVRQDLPSSLIIRNKITGEFRLIDKRKLPS